MPRALTHFPRKDVIESTRAAGARVERRVAWHYRLRGYRILARNARAGGYEIDLIARRGQDLVVCEVKSKAGEEFGDSAEMVDEEKRRRLRRAADAWLAAHPDLADLDVRFDVVAVSPQRVVRIADAF